MVKDYERLRRLEGRQTGNLAYLTFYERTIHCLVKNKCFDDALEICRKIEICQLNSIEPGDVYHQCKLMLDEGLEMLENTFLSEHQLKHVSETYFFVVLFCGDISYWRCHILKSMGDLENARVWSNVLVHIYCSIRRKLHKYYDYLSRHSTTYIYIY